MELNYKTFGQGEPLLILHGLFGALDNWQTLGKQFADHYSVYLIDLRNHGRSPHEEAMNYPAMAQDLRQFMESHWIYGAQVLGHSMGGKAAMQLALNYPDMVSKLVVIDIAPRRYEAGHEEIFAALFSLDLKHFESRGEAEEKLAERIDNQAVRLFLLKNLARDKRGGYRWKMNLKVLHEHYADILAAVEGPEPYEGPALFVRGGRSDYIRESDFELIRARFPNAVIRTVEEAGHWVHAETPEQLKALLEEFLE